MYVEIWESAIHEQRHQYNDAVEAELQALQQNPDLTPADFVSLRSAFRTGGWKMFQKAEIEAFLPRAGAPCIYWGDIAMSYFRLGNTTEAFHWFNREVDGHCGDVAWRIGVDPRLDPVRTDLRYTALRRRMNLPQ